ncbi:MAG: tRNA 2-selenouridine(34) synthase MnmH [Bacteroidetes bacterium]|nr:MAG: tRNA 2-selenouridine(34) synthase MnmH [Bacteroidota bacterium]
MVEQTGIEQMLLNRSHTTLVDVRTPAEFEKGHVPGAVNLPLFSNEERAVVGTIYKKESPQAALLKGLDFVGPKMTKFIKSAEKLAPDKRVTIHCWRGGKRSSSMGWLLDTAGFQVKVLNGGYKAYRQYIHARFDEDFPNMIILGGFTGSAKTEILNALKEQGEQFLDLEGVAHHKGSAFGALGQEKQPQVEQFENNLYDALTEIDTSRRFWVEDESRSIGRVYVPQNFWATMRTKPVIFLKRKLDHRVDHLVKGYACFSTEELAHSFEKIQRRLGGQHLKAALEALEKDDYPTAATIALKYYDKAYSKALERRSETCEVIPFETNEIKPETIAEQLIQFVNHELK